MTIASTTNRVTTVGNGSTTAYPVSFPFHAQADLIVVSTVILTGVQTTKTITTHYTISGTPDALGHYSNGGTVNFLVAPASTERITIYRDPSRVQSLDLVENNSLPAESLEASIDYQTMLIQRVADLIGRSLRQPDGDSANIGVLPSAVDRASKYLGFNASSDPIALGAPTNTSLTTPFIETLLDDTTSIAALATLGASEIEPTDLAFRIRGSSDQTKKVAFEVDGLTTATTRTVTVPDASGTLALNAAQADVDAGTAVKAITTNLNRLSLLTAVLTTSGTAFDFTIPAGTRKITLMLNGVSLSGTDDLLVQLGDAGGVETSGYTSASAGLAAAAVGLSTSTAGLVMRSAVAANVICGTMTLVLQNPATFTWVASHAGQLSTTICLTGGGVKSLTQEATTLRLTRTGTDTFDAGLINVMYER